MAKNIKELRDLRGKAVADARAILDRADSEKRARTEDEIRQYDAFMADERRLKLDIETEERQQELDREMAAQAIADASKEGRKVENPGEELRKVAFRKLLTQGKEFMSGEELRSLTSGNDVSGGFLNTPQEFVQQLIVAVKNKVFMRGLATIIPLASAVSCGIPTLDTDVSDADWTPEIKAVAEDSDMAFGKRELKPHPLSKLVKVSNKLLRSGALNPETIVMDRLAYKFAVPTEKAYLVGDGLQKALGVFTASADGITTARDISTGNSATEMKADGLIAAKYNLKAQYMEASKWIFHRDGIRQLAQIKDGEGRYIFDLAEKPGVPDMLLGRPLVMSEYAPNTFTANSYVGILGDFSYYWIADSLALEFRRLNELFALTDQVGFIGRMETDGMPVLSEAFSRVQLSA